MKSNKLLVQFVLLTVGTFFLFKGAILAESFLVPLTFAVLLTLITIPLTRKLEKKGVGPIWATSISVTVCLLAYLAFFFIIGLQIGSVTSRWSEAEKELQPRIDELVQLVEEKTGMNVKQEMPSWLSANDSTETADPAQPPAGPLKTNEKDQPAETSTSASESSEKSSTSSKSVSSSAPGGVTEQLGQVAINIFSFLGNSVLTFIYLFFFLHCRRKVKLSILRFFDEEERERTQKVLEECVKLSLDFLVGRFLLILALAIIYTAGLLIAGIEDAILIGVLAALMSLLPFVGVIAGYLLAIVMALVGGAETWSLIVVTVTFGLAQFIEGNILEPYVVGDKVNVNPLVTIVVVVIGSAVWGVAGMILSIPIAGILKIIFDASKQLEPLGYMLGEEDVSDDNEDGFLSKWGDKLAKMFKKK
jgi:predicted PurR-regulated permease PerM